MAIHWLLLSTVVVLIVQQLLFRYFGLKRLAYKRSFSARSCYEGDRIEMIEQLVNRKRLPVPWLRVESQLHSGLKFEGHFNFDVSSGQYYQNHSSLFSLGGYKQLTRRHSVQCVRRGCFRLESASLTIGDLFGFFRVWQPVKLAEELLVYPQPLERDQLELPSSSWLGEVSVKRWIVHDPFLISGARGYQSGDPLNTVNWQATARAGSLQVHKHDFTADFRLMVMLNIEDHEGMWETVNDSERIEYGIRYAAGAAQFAAEQGLEFGFASNGHDIDSPGLPILLPFSAGNEQLIGAMEAMARMIIARSTPFDVLLEQMEQRLPERSDVVVVSSFWSEKIEQAADKLRREGHSVYWANIGPDKEEAA